MIRNQGLPKIPEPHDFQGGLSAWLFSVQKTGVAVLTAAVAIGGAYFTRHGNGDADLSQSSTEISKKEARSLITKAVGLASEAADLGQIKEYEEAADMAESFARRTGLDLSREDKQLLRSAGKRVQEKQISEALNSSKELADAGDTDRFDTAVRQIRKQARECKITLSQEQEDIIAGFFKTSREKSISPALERAVEAARRGEVERCDYEIIQARTSLEEAKLTPSSHQEALMAEVYKTARINGITPKINEALKAAAEGMLKESEYAVSDLKRYASEAGISLSKEQEALLLKVREEQKKRPPATRPAPRPMGINNVRIAGLEKFDCEIHKLNGRSRFS